MSDRFIDSRLQTAPSDPDVHKRMARLRELGLGDEPIREFDEFAAQLANRAGTPLAMVNFIGTDKQFFAGLYAPGSSTSDAIEAAQANSNEVSRVMARDHGWCPHVVARKKALVLDDVCSMPRFSGNPVVDEIGIRSYIGAPLMDPETGVALGTICGVSQSTSEWGRPGLDMIKGMAAQLVDLIYRRK